MYIYVIIVFNFGSSVASRCFQHRNLETSGASGGIWGASGSIWAEVKNFEFWKPEIKQ